MKALSVVIITFNEEKNIGRCIDSVRDIADEIIVLDSFSTDQTTSIALEKGAIVKQQSFAGYYQQKNSVIQMTSYDYVLSLDADEALSEALANSILEAKKEFAFRAYTMNRSNIYRGRKIKHGLWYPDKKLRLFDKNIGYCTGLNPHDKIELRSTVPIMQLKGEILHYTYSNVEEYLQRNEELSTVAAQSLYDAGMIKHWSKLFLSPLWAFLNGYFLRCGFLDGYDGFVIAICTANQSYRKYYKLKQLHNKEDRSSEVKEMQWSKVL